MTRAPAGTVAVAAVLALVVALLCAGAPAAGAYTVLPGADNAPAVSVPDTTTRLPGRRLSPSRAIAIAGAIPAIRTLMAGNPGAFPGVYTKGAHRWQVSFFTRHGSAPSKEIGQVLIDDRSGRVLEEWTGFQIAWPMARGYTGAFGESLDAIWIWVPLSVLFVAPFVDWRRPWRLRNLDLLVLSSFSLSLAFFNHADIGLSTPLVYPPLVYLLARMLMVAAPGRRTRGAPVPAVLHLNVSARWLGIGVIALLAFRIALNMGNANVIDVGYAGVVGAHKVVHGQPMYGGWPSDNAHGDTYGPVAYEAYIPFVAAFGWSGRWDDLPAAHGAAIAFDLLALAGLFALGRRVRGPTLGIALAWAWVAWPFTLFALNSDSNDALVAALVIWSLLACASRHGRRAASDGRHMVARGVLAALAGLAKFAPLALAPLLATDGLYDAPRRRRLIALATFGAAFAACAAIVSIPVLDAGSLHTFVQRTVVYQADRDAPFSLWGLYGGLSAVQVAVQVAAVALAIGLAIVPRRRDAVGLAAAAAAILIAVQLGADYWFYLYLPWFFGPAMLALLAGERAPGVTAGEPAEPARSRQLAAA